MTTVPDTAAYLALKDYYETCLAAHGPTHLGVDWPDAEGMLARFAVMADAIPQAAWAGKPHILDVGCGPGLFLAYLTDRFGAEAFTYTGIDISPAMIAAARATYPGICFRAQDLITLRMPDAAVDFAVFNGVFTVRESMSVAQAKAFAAELLSAVFPACRHGLAANFMAPHADWRDDKLFYLSFDEAAALFKDTLSRHFAFRSDYGLWEYTAQVLHQPG